MYVPASVFQSSSSPKTGCKVQLGEHIIARLCVSILIQPEDRMQADSTAVASFKLLFQSSSSPKTGCKIGLSRRYSG